MKLGKRAWSEMSGARLRDVRRRLGITQAALGVALGISALEISRKERGVRKITKQQALAVECLLWRAGGEPVVTEWHNTRGVE